MISNKCFYFNNLQEILYISLWKRIYKDRSENGCKILVDSHLAICPSESKALNQHYYFIHNQNPGKSKKQKRHLKSENKQSLASFNTNRSSPNCSRFKQRSNVKQGLIYHLQRWSIPCGHLPRQHVHLVQRKPESSSREKRQCQTPLVHKTQILDL